jgi:hypothetical protein
MRASDAAAALLKAGDAGHHFADRMGGGIARQAKLGHVLLRCGHL